MVNKLEKISLKTIPSKGISGSHNRFNRNDVIITTKVRENREFDKQMQKRCTIRPCDDSKHCKFNWVIKCHCRGSDTCSSIHKGISNAQNKVAFKSADIQCRAYSPKPLQRGDPVEDPKSHTMEWEAVNHSKKI
jgi:hypothetical protein